MNNIEKLKVVRIIGYILLFTIFLQIILGAWVRLTGSGMSCPDWPLCYGFLIPTPEKIRTIGSIDYTYFQVFLEWIHRANAAFIIGPTCIFFSFYMIYYKKNLKYFKKYAYLLLILIFIQGGLGGLTVFKANIPWSVAIHLIFAFLLYLTTLIIITKTYNISDNSFNAQKYIKINTFITGMLTMLAAALGAFTSKYGASLSCDTWPGCGSRFFPNFNDMFEIIHFSHRLVALLLVIALVVLYITLINYIKILPYRIKKILILIFSIISLQVIVGAFLIFMKVPVWMGVFHQATGLFLFTLITLLYLHINFNTKNEIY